MYRRYTVPGFDVLSGVWWKARFQNDKTVVGLQLLHAATDFFDAVRNAILFDAHVAPDGFEDHHS